MTRSARRIRVYVEVGVKRTFATALDWPGWSRSGRDEDAALATLAAYGPRYARAVAVAKLDFVAPLDAAALSILARLKGTTTTDFGAPDAAAPGDRDPLNGKEVRRSLAIVSACWRTFDRRLAQAGGRRLRKGPRGGGRELKEIGWHVLEAQAAYLGRVGWPFTVDPRAPLAAELRRARDESQAGLEAAMRGDLPARGPRGGLRWTPRYFIRRAAWHLLDHAWEIEDRSA
jgi:hypothetical protein